MSSGAIKNNFGGFEARSDDFDGRRASHNRAVQKAYFRKLTAYISEVFKHKNTSYYLQVQNNVVSFLALNNKKDYPIDYYFASEGDDLPVEGNSDLKNILKKELGLI